MNIKDEYALVLDFLKHGYSSQARSQPVAQVIGDTYFNLLEIVPRDDISLKSQDRIYIGAGKRDDVKSIVSKIPASKLTSTAQLELQFAIESIIEKNEKVIDFFNNAGPLTTKQHQLELLPGIGKKHMWQIIQERKKEPFKDLEDLKKRVTLLPDPKKAIVKRIIEEIEGDCKWYLFVTPPKKDF